MIPMWRIIMRKLTKLMEPVSSEMDRSPDHPFFSVDNIVQIRDAVLRAGVPNVDPEVLSHHMLEVSRELKIHYDDAMLGPLNREVIQRMIKWGHPEAAFIDHVNELPDKAPMDVLFRDDTSGQPPQFEEKPIDMPPHLAAQIQFRPFPD